MILETFTSLLIYHKWDRLESLACLWPTGITHSVEYHDVKLGVEPARDLWINWVDRRHG